MPEAHKPPLPFVETTVARLMLARSRTALHRVWQRIDEAKAACAPDEAKNSGK